LSPVWTGLKTISATNEDVPVWLRGSTL